MGINAQGIHEWEPTDSFPGWRDVFTASVTDTVADLRSDIETAGGGADDTGWVALVLGANITAVVGRAPRVRRIGSRVDVFGQAVLGAGFGTGRLVVVPPGFRPAGAYGDEIFGTNLVNLGGKIVSYVLRVPGHADAHHIGIAYQSAPLVAGEVLTLRGSWFVN